MKINLAIRIKKEPKGWEVTILGAALNGTIPIAYRDKLEDDSILNMNEWVDEMIVKIQRSHQVLNLFRENFRGEVTGYRFGREHTHLKTIINHKQEPYSVSAIIDEAEERIEYISGKAI